jgi:hypothetical protein
MMDISSRIDLLLMEQGIDTPDPSVEVVNRVYQHILNGESKLKIPLASSQATMMDVVRCIKNERCLCTKERDLGSSYLEQTISKAIREVVPIQSLNAARDIFGLAPLSHDELQEIMRKEAAGKGVISDPSRINR